MQIAATHPGKNTNMAAAIQLENVTKSFGEKTAVDAMNLTIPRGGLYGYIGPNGAGKTTTIRMMMSITIIRRVRAA